MKNKKPQAKACGIHYKKLDRAIHPEFENSGILAFCNKTIIILAILLLAGAVYAGVRTPTTPWYEVEEWEQEVCSKWAGNAEPENAETETGYYSYGTSSMTMQAFKTDMGNQTFYEIYYYLEPYDGPQEYTIQLINEKRQLRAEIASGTAGIQAGIADYHTEYSAREYTHARMIHKHGRFTIPIIEK